MPREERCATKDTNSCKYFFALSLSFCVSNVSNLVIAVCKEARADVLRALLFTFCLCLLRTDLDFFGGFLVFPVCAIYIRTSIQNWTMVIILKPQCQAKHCHRMTVDMLILSSPHLPPSPTLNVIDEPLIGKRAVLCPYDLEALRSHQSNTFVKCVALTPLSFMRRSVHMRDKAFYFQTRLQT